MNTDRAVITSGGGRTVVSWRSHEPDGRQRGPVVVIAPGMGRRMRHAGVIAQYLTANGAIAYRYDGLDHIGQSDGDIANFSLASAMESMRAVVDHAVREEGAQRLVILPNSFSAVPAYHLAAADPRVGRLVCLSGVVDARATLARSLGVDYGAWALDDLPERVRFEGYQFDPRVMFSEHRRTDWYSIDCTIATLARVPAPVVNVIGLGDEWVTPDEVRRAFGVEGMGERLVVQLPHVSHSVGRNPVALRVVLGAVTRLALELPEDADLVEPTFEEILDVRAAERRREHEEMLALRGAH